jgi:hypothetical protein
MRDRHTAICVVVCARADFAGTSRLFLGSVLEGWAWWEWLHCTGAGGPGVAALESSLSSAEGVGLQMRGIESLKLE